MKVRVTQLLIVFLQSNLFPETLLLTGHIFVCRLICHQIKAQRFARICALLAGRDAIPAGLECDQHVV